MANELAVETASPEAQEAIKPIVLKVHINPRNRELVSTEEYLKNYSLAHNRVQNEYEAIYRNVKAESDAEKPSVNNAEQNIIATEESVDTISHKKFLTIDDLAATSEVMTASMLANRDLTAFSALAGYNWLLPDLTMVGSNGMVVIEYIDDSAVQYGAFTVEGMSQSEAVQLLRDLGI